jgi:hypothetical protein
VQQVLNWNSYDDASLWKPKAGGSNYVCPVGVDQSWYESNPTQLFIGKPASGSSIVISNTPINIRLLDKQFGMFLAYAMDDFGHNPHALLGLSTKESFATAVAPNTNNLDFLAADLAAGYDLYGTHFGYGTDANKDGPFQVESPTMVRFFIIHHMM